MSTLNEPVHRGEIMSDQQGQVISRRRAMAASIGTFGLAAMMGQRASAQRKSKKRSPKDKRVLVCLGEFSEGMETYYMIYRLMEENLVPVIAAKDVKLLQLVVHDFDPQFSNYIEMPGYKIQTEIAYADVKPEDYEALLIPGGRGPEEIRQYQDVLDLVGFFVDNNLPLGAMCHGPQVVWAARSMKGRKLASYYGIRADLELAGARFVDAPAVVDGNLVTSRGWPDLPDFMPKFLEVMA
jgi:protease I